MLSTEKQFGLMRIEMIETGFNLVFKNGKEGKKRKGKKKEEERKKRKKREGGKHF